MFTLLSRTFFISVLIFTTTFADEDDIERLMVPEIQETLASPIENQLEEINPEETMHEEAQEHAPEQLDAPQEIIEEHNPNEESSIQDTDTNHEDTSTQENQNQPEENREQELTESEVSNTPSEDEVEAKHAEEVELREVGAGE